MANEENEEEKFEPKSLLIKITAFICVLFIGAAIFVAIETSYSTTTSKDSGSHLIGNDSEIFNITSKYNISQEDLVKLRRIIENDLSRSEGAGEVKWSFGKAAFLTFTIMTTIGYGNMTPQSWQGQLFCIFFSLFAIPVSGIMLMAVGGHISLAIRKFVRFVEKKLLHREMAGSAELKSTIATIILMILMIIFGALLTSHTEGWTFVEGAYFTFISLSTIGFGDYVMNNGEFEHADDAKTVVINLTVVLIVLGLCVVSSVLCSVSSVIEERQKRMRGLQLHMRVPTSASNAFSQINNVSKKLGRKEKVGSSNEIGPDTPLSNLQQNDASSQEA